MIVLPARLPYPQRKLKISSFFLWRFRTPNQLTVTLFHTTTVHIPSAKYLTTNFSSAKYQKPTTANKKSVYKLFALSDNEVPYLTTSPKSWRTLFSEETSLSDSSFKKSSLFWVFQASVWFWNKLSAGSQDARLFIDIKTVASDWFEGFIALFPVNFDILQPFTCNSMERGNLITYFWPSQNPLANLFPELPHYPISHRRNVPVYKVIRQGRCHPDQYWLC
jgi:hypothetical protein